MKKQSEGIKEEAILTGIFATLRLVKHTIIETFEDETVTKICNKIDEVITELTSDGNPDSDAEDSLHKHIVSNSEAAFCQDCPHKGKPMQDEPCYTCHYYNLFCKHPNITYCKRAIDDEYDCNTCKWRTK